MIKNMALEIRLDLRPDRQDKRPPYTFRTALHRRLPRVPLRRENHITCGYPSRFPRVGHLIADRPCPALLRRRPVVHFYLCHFL